MSATYSVYIGDPGEENEEAREPLPRDVVSRWLRDLRDVDLQSETSAGLARDGIVVAISVYTLEEDDLEEVAAEVSSGDPAAFIPDLRDLLLSLSDLADECGGVLTNDQDEQIERSTIEAHLAGLG